jgi:hypothetical protein
MTVNHDGTENVLLASSCDNYDRAASTDIDEETERNPLNRARSRRSPRRRSWTRQSWSTGLTGPHCG